MKSTLRLLFLLLILGVAAFFFIRSLNSRCGIECEPEVVAVMNHKPVVRPVVKPVLLFLSLDTATAKVGSDFVVSAMIDPGSEKITVAELRLAYDPTKLRFVSATTEGTPLSVMLSTTTVDAKKGTVSLSAGVPLTKPATPIVQKSIVASFIFKALATASSTSITIATSSALYALGKDENVTATMMGLIINLTPAK